MLNSTVSKAQAIAFVQRLYNDGNWEREFTITSVGAAGHIASLNLVRHDDCDDDELYEAFPVEDLKEERLQLIFKGLEFSYELLEDPTLGNTVKEPYLGAYSLHVLDTFTGEMTMMTTELAEAVMYRLKASDLALEFKSYIDMQNCINELVDGKRYNMIWHNGITVTPLKLYTYQRSTNSFSSMSGNVSFDKVIQIFDTDTGKMLYRRK